MADTKISALTASTTPLAGTEVLPIVQSGVTKQVSVANLTAGRAISATELTLTTGNLIVANGQGIDFSATSHPAGMTSELLDDYEEGTWTPTDASGAGLTLTTSNTNYTKIGNTVFVTGVITWPSTVDVSAAQIGGLPFTSKAASAGFLSGVNNASLALLGNIPSSSASFYISQDSTTNNQTNAVLSTKLFAFSGTYLAA